MNVLTGWFPASVKPVRTGDYLTRLKVCAIPVLCRWNGSEWRYASGDETMYQHREWRGLAFNPGALPDARTQREIQSWAHGWWAAMEAKRSGA